jgi:hypothetical protein
MTTKPKPKKLGGKMREPPPVPPTAEKEDEMVNHPEERRAERLYLTPFSRYVTRATGAGFVTSDQRVLQQLWAPSGWHGNEPLGDENWRPEGEWRDVPTEEEST